MKPLTNFKFMHMVSAFSVIFLTLGCSSPTSPPLSEVILLFKSSDDLNPDINKRPSPVDIRIYQLRNSDYFMQSKFLDLYADVQKTLDKSLIEEHRIEVNIKQTSELKISLYEETQYLGFIVAYYDIENAKWRDIQCIKGTKGSFFIALNARDFFIQPS